MEKMIKNLSKRYVEDKTGQVAVITAVAAVPIMLVVSIGLDSQVIDRSRSQLQSALDNAALAAVSDQTLTPDERAEHARDRFWANMADENNITFQVSSSDSNRIDVNGKMEIDTLFAGVIGRDTVAFEAESAAKVVKGETICMLALDPDSNRSFEVTTGAILNANCTVQVNSVSDVASIVDHGGTATAESFCVGGGARGEHFPFINTECATLSDPYANVEIPGTILPCTTLAEIEELRSDWRSNRNAVETHNTSQDLSVTNAEAVGQTYDATYFVKSRLKPGNYCDGLLLIGNEFEFDPGEYHITGGDLIFGGGSELFGRGVTFILHGDARLEIDGGSIIDIGGPTEGPLDGLVFAQNLKDRSIYNPTYPNVESLITSGSILDVLGTIYLPSHKIKFEAGIEGNTHAPATSFIAHQISLAAGADLTVSVDHVTAGISPIQPRADGGVRLVK